MEVIYDNHANDIEYFNIHDKTRFENMSIDELQLKLNLERIKRDELSRAFDLTWDETIKHKMKASSRKIAKIKQFIYEKSKLNFSKDEAISACHEEIRKLKNILKNHESRIKKLSSENKQLTDFRKMVYVEFGQSAVEKMRSKHKKDFHQ